MEKTKQYLHIENIIAIILIIAIFTLHILEDFGIVNTTVILITLSIVFITFTTFNLIKFKTKKDIVTFVLSALFVILSILKIFY